MLKGLFVCTVVIAMPLAVAAQQQPKEKPQGYVVSDDGSAVLVPRVAIYARPALSGIFSTPACTVGRVERIGTSNGPIDVDQTLCRNAVEASKFDTFGTMVATKRGLDDRFGSVSTRLDGLETKILTALGAITGENVTLAQNHEVGTRLTNLEAAVQDIKKRLDAIDAKFSAAAAKK
jgi:hypothetical protein